MLGTPISGGANKLRLEEKMRRKLRLEMNRRSHA
jgi:hypothetical protein